MEKETKDNFEIHLPLFEGPFDLLLFFIERDELEITDIPISKITNDFLEYIHHLEVLNIEVASEFILVAATLMRIKSRLLLPRPQLDEQGNEIDPREELVRHLMEKGWVGSRHSHPHEQLVYIIRGHIQFKGGDKIFDAREGDSFVVPGGIDHQASAVEESEVLDVFAPLREDYAVNS